MRKTILAAALASASFAAPAAAQTGWYVGVSAGITMPRTEGIDVSIPDGPSPLLSPMAVPAETIADFFTVDYKTGYDLDLTAGYDFGWLATELELSQKRAKHDSYDTFYFYSGEELDADGYTRSRSALINAFVQASPAAGWTIYAGPGIGIADVKLKFDADGESFKLRDSGLALQGTVGVARAITPQLSLGAKYRYFEATGIKENIDAFADNNVFKTALRTHSLLATLTYKLAAPMAPVAAPVAVVPAPAATVTCADGSQAADMASCPAQPVETAPVAPAPATGERG